jgi:uncharacterized membrane protein
VRLTLLEIYAGIFYSLAWRLVFGDSIWSFAFMMLFIVIVAIVASLFNEKRSEQHTIGEYWEDEDDTITH